MGTRMDAHSLATLEYPRILQQLADYAAFSASHALVMALRPAADIATVELRQQETTEAKRLLSTRVEVSVGELATSGKPHAVPASMRRWLRRIC